MELNEQAWDRWRSYRSAIKKPIKDASEGAMKLKLSRMGDADMQDRIVTQSIENTWTGLFPLKVEKADPNAPKKRTSEEQKAADASFRFAESVSERGWDAEIAKRGTIAKIELAAALYARYQTNPEARSDDIEWLRGKVGELIRSTDPKAVLMNYTARRLVLQMFNWKAIHRLEDLAKQREAA